MGGWDIKIKQACFSRTINCLNKQFGDFWVEILEKMDFLTQNNWKWVKKEGRMGKNKKIKMQICTWKYRILQMDSTKLFWSLILNSEWQNIK